MPAVGFIDVMDGADVRVVQGGRGSCLAQEALNHQWIWEKADTR